MIEDFKHCYNGERVFLVGNGPSLAETPLDRIKNEYSFAMNRISLIYDETEWRPTFFICTTTNIAIQEWRSDILRSISMNLDSFVWDELDKYIGPRPNVNYINCTHGSQVTSEPPTEWWSDDVSQRVCKFGTSMLVALQIAIYMGFDEIYLIGCDLGFEDPWNNRIGKVIHTLRQKKKATNDNNHFSGNYGTPGFNADVLNSNMRAAHRLAKRMSEKKDVNIYNATIGGELEVYPRVDYYEVTEKSVSGL